MATKIDLQERRKSTIYSIVIANSSAPRDGRFIENRFYSPFVIRKILKIGNKPKEQIFGSKQVPPTDTVMNMLSRVSDIQLPTKLQKKFSSRAKKNTGIKVKKSATN